jgi:hypothetical protein
MRKQVQRHVHSVLWQQMPDLGVFATFVESDLIEPQFLEPLVMKFVNSPLNRNLDYCPFISIVYELVHSDTFEISELSD